MKNRKEKAMRALTVVGPDGRPLILDLATLQTYEVDRIARGVASGHLLELSEYEVMKSRKSRLKKEMKGRSWNEHVGSMEVIVNTDTQESWEKYGSHYIFSSLGKEGRGAGWK